LTVLKLDGLRIDRIKISIQPVDEPAPEAEPVAIGEAS
jgi:hypothetical protein